MRRPPKYARGLQERQNGHIENQQIMRSSAAGLSHAPILKVQPSEFVKQERRNQHPSRKDET